MPLYRMFGYIKSAVSIPKLIYNSIDNHVLFQFSIHLKPSDGMSGISIYRYRYARYFLIKIISD